MLKVHPVGSQSKAIIIPTDNKISPVSPDSGNPKTGEAASLDGNLAGAAIDCTSPGAPIVAEQVASTVQSGLYDVKVGSIPGSLRAIPNWVNWQSEPNEQGKLTKPPYTSGTQNKAETDKPQSWRPYEESTQTLNGQCGLGWVLPLTGEFFFVDLDDVRNPDTGEIAPWARRLVEKLGTYTEISPSQDGLHIVGRVSSALPIKGLKKKLIELYTVGRYMTVTGCRLETTPADLASVDIACLYRLIEAGVFDFQEKSTYSALFNNIGKDWKDYYPSQSEADMALCGFLSKKLDNPEDIDSGFRLSGLMRPKWNEARGLFVQDIGHAHGAYKPPWDSMSRTLLSLAGFQVIISGRFWVIAEG